MYELLDSGDGQKLEAFGKKILIRPAAAAIWRKARPKLWETAHASFSREEGLVWEGKEKLSASWDMELEGVRLKLKATDFGHVGAFPEHASMWTWFREHLRTMEDPRFLNLFAYSGAASVAATQAGAKVTHVDASKGMLDWAKDNLLLNGYEPTAWRWICDDVMKFLRREVRRGELYDAILLDPPSFGRGKNKECFIIENSILELTELCVQLLKPKALLGLSSHSLGFSPTVLQELLKSCLKHKKAHIESGELLLRPLTPSSPFLPCGTYARACIE